MPQVREAEAGRYVFDLSLPIKRVQIGDLDNGPWHVWLMRRLGERWPHIGPQNFRGHAISWINSNEHLFARCGKATALAMRTMEPLGTQAIVREIFVFVENKDTQAWRREMTRLYREMQIWAASLGVAGVKIDNAVDLTQGRLIELVGADQEIELWLRPQKA